MIQMYQEIAGPEIDPAGGPWLFCQAFLSHILPLPLSIGTALLSKDSRIYPCAQDV